MDGQTNMKFITLFVCGAEVSTNLTCALQTRHVSNKQHYSDVAKGDVIRWVPSAADSLKYDKMNVKRKIVKGLEVKGWKSEWDNGTVPPILQDRESDKRGRKEIR